MELLLSLLSEDMLLKYIMVKMLYLLPYFAAFFFIALNLNAELNLYRTWFKENHRQLVKVIRHFNVSPILRWSIKVLSKMSDDEEAALIMI